MLLCRLGLVYVNFFLPSLLCKTVMFVKLEQNIKDTRNSHLIATLRMLYVLQTTITPHCRGYQTNVVVLSLK